MNSKIAYKELSLLIGFIVAILVLFTVWISRSSFVHPSTESNLRAPGYFPTILQAFDKRATAKIDKSIAPAATGTHSSVTLSQWLY